MYNPSTHQDHIRFQLSTVTDRGLFRLVKSRLSCSLLIAELRVHCAQPATNYKSQITNYKLRITNYDLQITNYKLQITNYNALLILLLQGDSVNNGALTRDMHLKLKLPLHYCYFKVRMTALLMALSLATC